MDKAQLLRIDDEEVLEKEGIIDIQVQYRQAFVKSIISYIFKSRRDIKSFTISEWITFKEGIISNLYEKDLCKIEFTR